MLKSSMVMYFYVFLSLCIAMLDRLLIGPVFHLFTHNFINFVWCIQHLGNVLIYPTLTPIHLGVVVFVMISSHNAKPYQNT